MATPSSPPLYTIPIDARPPHGPLFSKILFPILFNAGLLGINSAQFCALPLLLLPFVGRKLYNAAIDWTKDGFGRLLIAITVLFAPTSLVLTTDTPPDLAGLVERDPQTGQVVRVNLPDRLVLMANHQAYTDWMYLWILSCYSGNSTGITILLKDSLRKVPVVGWGMRFFRFIFLARSWASDRENLTRNLTRLGQEARSSTEDDPTHATAAQGADERSSLLGKAKATGRRPLWLVIFPEGTIPSDDERPKSAKYAAREGIDDFKTMLHPRSTGLLFILRTLLPQVPDLQLLDLTIGYPGVPYGKYPQEWYGLFSVFYRSVPPPTVHIHLHLHTNLSSPTCPIPSLLSSAHPASHQPSPATTKDGVPTEPPSLASPEEARAFELWLRGVWVEKEERMTKFAADQKFCSGEGGEGAREVVPVTQQKWYHWIAAVGGGGMGTLAVAGVTAWQIVASAR